jgi:hypothetical protein
MLRIQQSRQTRLAGHLVRLAALSERMELLKKKYAKYDIGDWLMKKIAQIDPLHGPYMEWIIRQLINNHISISGVDFDQTNYYLRVFDYIKKSPKLMKQYGIPSDIQQLNFSQLEDLIEKYVVEGSPRSEREQQRSNKIGGARIFYDKPPMKIIVIGGPGVDIADAQGAACLYAKNTRWCTSDPYVAKGYLEESPLYVFFKNNQRVAQYYSSGEFKDTQDIELVLSDPENEDTIMALIDSGIEVPAPLAERLKHAGYPLSPALDSVLQREQDFRQSVFEELG